MPVIIILSSISGFDGVIRAQFIADLGTTIIAFIIFRITLWKEVFKIKSVY